MSAPEPLEVVNRPESSLLLDCSSRSALSGSSVFSCAASLRFWVRFYIMAVSMMMSWNSASMILSAMEQLMLILLCFSQTQHSYESNH